MTPPKAPTASTSPAALALTILAAVACNPRPPTAGPSVKAERPGYDPALMSDVPMPEAPTPTTADEEAPRAETAGAAVARGPGDPSVSSGPPQTLGPPRTLGPPVSGPPVAAFVAQGHMGRTLVSCDDGKSWTADRAFDREGDPAVCGIRSEVRCFADGGGCAFHDGKTCVTAGSRCDCDHHPGAAHGIVFAQGHFVATWGWGKPGSVRRSQDGVHWETVLSGTTFGGVAFGKGRFVLGDPAPRVSLNGGKTWQQGGPAKLQSPSGKPIWNVRALAFADVLGGRFVLTGESGPARDVLISDDGGQRFARPARLPAECGQGVRGIAGGDDVIVIAHRDGRICRSENGGTGFTVAHAGGPIAAAPIWDGARFLAWGRGVRFESRDGRDWRQSPTQPKDFAPAAVARNPNTETLVAVGGAWGAWYEAQVFYRSTDGVTWRALEGESAPGGHPIVDIAFGTIAPGAACSGQP